MYSEGSLTSPEGLDCYEECVVSDEIYLSPSSPSGTVCTASALVSDSSAAARRGTDCIPKSNSGRISKKSETMFSNINKEYNSVQCINFVVSVIYSYVGAWWLRVVWSHY